MTNPQKMTAKLSTKEEYSHRYCLYRFELQAPHTIVNEAGQYVMLEVGEGQKRAYSMCDRPDIDSSFEILVDHEPNGVGVNFLRSLQFGQKVQLIGPLGALTVKPEWDQSEPLVLVATGSGIAPFKAIITDLLQIKKDPRPVQLYWGMRHDDDLFWLDDFQAIAAAYSQFEFIPLVSRPSDLWSGQTGRVTDYLHSAKIKTSARYLLCGRGEMLDEVKQILIAQNVDANRIVIEKFTTTPAA
jgi:NAD(P)H-flavin reductase